MAVDTIQIPQQEKPSFLSSVSSGAVGYVKGMFAGGAIGAIGGGLIGAAIGVFTGGIPAALIVGAAYGAGSLATLGGFAGAVTGVVKSREVNQPSTQDIDNLANIAFAQGRAVEQSLGQTTQNQDRLNVERATPESRVRH